MEQDFKKYNSIENHYQENFINKIKEANSGLNVQWFVTEKIHGCNAQISYDGKEVRYGKRTSYIENEKFSHINVVPISAPKGSSAIAINISSVPSVGVRYAYSPSIFVILKVLPSILIPLFTFL